MIAKDVAVAEKVYGKDIASLKGKTTRRKPPTVTIDTVEIPPELKLNQQLVDLCIDAFFVNGITFLGSISKRLQYRKADHVATRQASDYRSALATTLRLYMRAGFQLIWIHADREFRPVLKAMQDEYEFIPIFSSAQAHVPDAEMNIRVIKERVRACYHSWH